MTKARKAFKGLRGHNPPCPKMFQNVAKYSMCSTQGSDHDLAQHNRAAHATSNKHNKLTNDMETSWAKTKRPTLSVNALLRAARKVDKKEHQNTGLQAHLTILEFDSPSCSWTIMDLSFHESISAGHQNCNDCAFPQINAGGKKSSH